MGAKKLLMVTALIEMGTGAALLIVPSFSAEFLLGEGLFSPQGLIVARVAGAALISLALACWFGKTGDARSQSGLVAGMLVYNLAVPILLMHGWFSSGFRGVG